MTNAERVKDWRKRTGHKKYREKYHWLREQGYMALDATEMKYWSWKRIKADFTERRAKQ